MLRRRPSLLIRPELDDRDLHVTLTDLRPAQQLHGLGAGRTRPPWEPVAELLRTTGRDWDRRVHRASVLAGGLPAAIVERWVAERPGDGDALVLHAHLLARRAPAEGRAAAQRAEQACLRAAQACPDDPTPWLALLSLLHSFGTPVRDAVPVWTEAVTRAPWNRTAYHRMLGYISPRGHGNVPDMMDFARQCALRVPPGSPLVLLPVAARVELFAHRRGQDPIAALGAGGHWNERQAVEEVEAALTGWFRTASPPHAEAVADLNILAFALTRTHRPVDAAPVFHRIGPYMTREPWDLLPDPERTFLYWRDRLS
ncbi:hypothetical protein [Streptomyces cavernae]|uniref:hypothetical protein n=1 Tax=Streptomyces cavernae TaxID=2259034 RepID=UPI000FEBF76D|nr:hypothetical protein [Streptomyces cavernae]